MASIPDMSTRPWRVVYFSSKVTRGAGLAGPVTRSTTLSTPTPDRLRPTTCRPACRAAGCRRPPGCRGDRNGMADTFAGSDRYGGRVPESLVGQLLGDVERGPPGRHRRGVGRRATRAPGLRTDLNRRTCPPSRSDPRDNQEGDGNQPRGKPGGMSLGVADRGAEWTTWSIW